MSLKNTLVENFTVPPATVCVTSLTKPYTLAIDFNQLLISSHNVVDYVKKLMAW